MSEDFERIDWPAIRDMVRAPAYYARPGNYDLNRGEDPEERAARKAKSRENKRKEKPTDD